MAMSCVIHRASRTVISPALRAVASSRIPFSSFVKDPTAEESFSTVTSDVLKKVDRKLINTITKSQFKSSSPFHYYNIQKPITPPGFPFEIEDDLNELGIELKREHEGEKIVVNVYDTIYPENWRSYSYEEGFSFSKPRIQLRLRITKETGKEITINLWAHVDYVGHPEVFVGNKRLSNEMSYDKEDYWREFIGVRGIDDSIGEYMMNYMKWRSACKYFLFWGKVKSFLNE
ncbi:hypothetical protein ACS0TY_015673 [Phlomoides rotata]